MAKRNSKISQMHANNAAFDMLSQNAEMFTFQTRLSAKKEGNAAPFASGARHLRRAGPSRSDLFDLIVLLLRCCPNVGVAGSAPRGTLPGT